MVVVAALTLVATACGDDGDGDAEAGTTTSADSTATDDTGSDETSSDDTAPDDTGDDADAPLTASFRGVSEDTIELGIASVDFQQLFDQGLVDFTHGDQLAIWDALIADVNDNGGVLGRQLTTVHDDYLPIGSTEAEQSCLVFTEDEEVFAVLGLWIGESVLCLTEQHETIHVGHLVRQEWVDRSIAPLVTADAVGERTLELLLTVLAESGELDDATIGVLTDDIASSSVDSVVVPFAEENDIDLGTVGVISNVATDPAAVAAEVDTFVERWRTEGVDFLLVVGNNGIGSIPRARAGLGDVTVATPLSDVLRQASGAAADDERPLYDGILSIGGLSTTNGEAIGEPLLAECIEVVEAAVPDLTVVQPGDLEGPDDWYAGISNACTSLHVFVEAAVAAGADLTNESFQAGLESLGSIALPGKAFASFGPGKWDGDDGFRLVVFDPLDSEDGSFAPLTEIVDTAQG